jgi:hypothetical protein
LPLLLQYLSKKVKFVRDIVREVAGFAPYERRIMELLKVGRDKRALKVAKKKVGSGTGAPTGQQQHQQQHHQQQQHWQHQRCLFRSLSA